jgi:hypothetical protein
VAHQFEIGPVHQATDILFCARKKVVHAEDIMAAVHQPVAKMRPQKTGPAGNQDSFLKMIHFSSNQYPDSASAMQGSSVEITADTGRFCLVYETALSTQNPHLSFDYRNTLLSW